MHTRIAVASPIYSMLIMQNQIGSAEDPRPYAERALMLADALIISDMQSCSPLHARALLRRHHHRRGQMPLPLRYPPPGPTPPCALH